MFSFENGRSVCGRKRRRPETKVATVTARRNRRTPIWLSERRAGAASVCGHAAIDVEDLAGDPPGSVQRDKHDAVGDFLGEAETIQRDLPHQGSLVLRGAGEAGQ